MNQDRIDELESIARGMRKACDRNECAEADRLQECLDEITRLRAYQDRFAAEAIRWDQLRDAVAITLSSMAHEIDAATNWWADKLMHVAVFDNGDRSAVGLATAVMAMALSAKNPVPTEAEIARFKASLHWRLRLRCVSTWRYDQPHWGSAHRTVHVDYGPDPVLRAACADAGIEHADSRFPCKTTMWIDPGKVQVAEGYGKGPVTIFLVAMARVVEPEPSDG